MVVFLSHTYSGYPFLHWKYYPLLSTSFTCSHHNKLTLRLPPFSTSNHHQPSLFVFMATTWATTNNKKWIICNGRFSHLKLNNNKGTSPPCSWSFTSNVENQSSTSKAAMDTLHLTTYVRFVLFNPAYVYVLFIFCICLLRYEFARKVFEKCPIVFYVLEQCLYFLFSSINLRTFDKNG